MTRAVVIPVSTRAARGVVTSAQRAPSFYAVSPTSGSAAGGTALVLSGYGFAGSSAVRIGGVSVAFSIASNDEIHCTTHAHAGGAVSIAIDLPTGTLTLAASYTFTSSVPVVSAVSYPVVDGGGGGQRVVVTVDNSTGCVSIAAGGVAFTSFLIDDATHVSGVPGAHASGVVDVVVTNGSGDSTTGTGLIRYWTPAEITGSAGAYDAEKGITVATGVSAWVDQSAAALNLAQAVGADQPSYDAATFGTLHGLTFTGAHVLSIGAQHLQATGRSLFWVGKYNSAQSTHPGYGGDNPLTVVGDGSGGVNVNAGHNAGTLSYQNYNAGWTETTEGAALNDGGARLYGWTHDTSGNLEAYVGAVQQGSTVAGQTYAAGTTGWNNIGQGFGGAADGFVGSLGAVVIVDGIISVGDLATLNAWSQQRWGTP